MHRRLGGACCSRLWAAGGTARRVRHRHGAAAPAEGPRGGGRGGRGGAAWAGGPGEQAHALHQTHAWSLAALWARRHSGNVPPREPRAGRCRTCAPRAGRCRTCAPRAGRCRTCALRRVLRCRCWAGGGRRHHRERVQHDGGVRDRGGRHGRRPAALRLHHLGCGRERQPRATKEGQGACCGVLRGCRLSVLRVLRMLLCADVVPSGTFLTRDGRYVIIGGNGEARWATHGSSTSHAPRSSQQLLHPDCVRADGL